MVIHKKALHRRTFLRGAGAALTLPLLDAMIPGAAVMRPRRTRPIRLAFIEVPNGIMMDKWTPSSEGANFGSTPILEPLSSFHDRMLVLSGLDQNQAEGVCERSGRRSSARLHRMAHAARTRG